MDRPVNEFFYVDVDRVRSLLAQMQGGVAEAVSQETTSTFDGGAQASLFGIGAHGGYAREARTSESRSLQDLTFVAFENHADEVGLIRQLDSKFFDPQEWISGAVHSSLTAGEIVRVECDVQVLDGSLFRERLLRFDRMAEALAVLTKPPSAQLNLKQRAQAVAAAKAETMRGVTPDALAAVAGFVGEFVGDSISMRLLPCGLEHLEAGFSGALLGRREYIQEERENLFSRYGSVASRWTSVVQIAAIPEDPAEGDSHVPSAGSLRPEGGISRAGMEQVAGNLLALMESIGLVEGPRWPSISVTPLGVYRPVPRLT